MTQAALGEAESLNDPANLARIEGFKRHEYLLKAGLETRFKQVVGEIAIV